MVVFGTRLYGKVERCGGTYVATRFAHLSSMPLLPLGSVLVIEELDAHRRRAIPIGLHLRSTSVALLRAWGTVPATLAIVASIFMLTNARRDERAVPFLLATASLVALVVLAWTWIGRLSLEQRAQRLAYGTFVDHPIDVAMLDGARDELRTRVRTIVRRGADAGVGALAIDLTTDDRRYLEAALLLTRLDWSGAPWRERRTLAAQHRAIWDRLKEIDPMTIELAREDS